MKYKELPRQLVVAGLFSLMVFLLLPASVVAKETLVNALVQGVTSMNIRSRIEKVSEDNSLLNASALTVRTRLGYQTETYKEFNAYIELENITAVGLDNYNGAYSVITDPEGSEVNRLSLSYRGFDSISMTMGRQRLVFDNARFVGNVGWRQNEQTFDALSIVNTSLPQLTVNYAYLTGVNTIMFVGRAVNSHLFNVHYAGLTVGELSFYGYFLDEQGSATDSATLGVRFKGSRSGAEGVTFIYALEMAQQSDYADALTSFDLAYRFTEIGVEIEGMTITLASESLAGNGDVAFETPLATKHAFNGWADRFLSTTAATGGRGLYDIIITVAGSRQGLDMKVVYHDFSADNGEILGSEIDLLAIRALSVNTLAGFKYAYYKANTWSVDATKVWMWVELKF